jgi:acylphosphatase
LPVFTLRTGLRHFEVTIGSPISVPKNGHGEPDYSAAIGVYAKMLAPFVERDPAQWRGWRAETSVGMQWKTSPSARPVSTGLIGRLARPLMTVFEKNVRVLIHGNVENVGLERWLQEHANRAGVTGWVRNRSDNTAEAVFEGRRQAVADLVANCRMGPSRAVVSEIIVKPRRVRSKRQGFWIRKPVQVDTGDEPRPKS